MIRFILCAGVALAVSAAETAPNTLSPAEAQAGWRLLWDGHTSAGWRGASHPEFPSKSWTMKDGELSAIASDKMGGDIVTVEKFSNFELSADFKIEPGTNSGIKIFFDNEVGRGTQPGLEYQIIDDERHPDAKLGHDGNRTLGSLYDLFPPAKTKKANPVGQWNTARIVAHGFKVEHWLNGEKILEYDRSDPKFAAAVQVSKFRTMKNFGELPEGRILLQDHKSAVPFRNVKILVLPSS